MRSRKNTEDRVDIPPSASIRELQRHNSLGALEGLATVARHDVGESIYRFNDPNEHWFRIMQGAARMSALTGDGRRHIVDFAMPGDLFGFGLSGGRRFCVEAIVPATLIARYPRRGGEQLADADPQIARTIREVAFESISRLQRRMVTLGRTSALEKVSTFLLEMADRSHIEPTQTVFLPMSRYDIADYLAMAVETVSRTLTELRARHMIAFAAVRQVRICDRNALEEVADRLPEPAAHPTRTPGGCVRHAGQLPADRSARLTRSGPPRAKTAGELTPVNADSCRSHDC
jgi:CRP/FNR family nitrogen fixation transcriptional regulator